MSGRQQTSTSDEAEKLKGFDDFDLLLGDIMRGERATMGKSLLDVQRELKIKANYIAAIENTDPSAFETPGFIAGYVRSYARYLGLDPEWAFKSFCAEGRFTVPHGMTSQPPVKRKSSQAQPVTGAGKKKPAHLRDPFTEPSVSYLPKAEALFAGIEPRAIGSMMVLIALLAGIGYGGWAVLQEVQKVRFTPVDQTPEVLADLDPVQSTLTAPAEGETESAEVAPAFGGFDRIYRPEALDVPVMVARDGPIAAIDPDTTGTLAPRGPDLGVAKVTPRPDNMPFAIPGESVDEGVIAGLDADNLLPPVQVVADSTPTVALLAVRPSWVRVTASDGTVVFEKILDAGETFEVPLTENAATLRAGNAGSLYFSVNGQTYGPAGAGPEVIKGVELAPEALTAAYAFADIERDADLKRFVAVAEANVSN
jgi:cytoskeletal protein RodZ